MGKLARQQSPHANRDVISALGLMLLATVPYLNSLTHDFVYDDKEQILGNQGSSRTETQANEAQNVARQFSRNPKCRQDQREEAHQFDY